MKKFLLICLLLFPSFAFANVDKTNKFDFNYECTESGEGILTADFNLGGHHHHIRKYKINRPGIFSIGDDKHVTIDKSEGLFIEGCGKQECKITQKGEWIKDSVKVLDTVVFTGNKVLEDTNGSIIIEKAGDEEITYQSSGKETKTLDYTNLKVEFGDAGLFLKGVDGEEEKDIFKINFTQRELSGLDTDNKKIIKENRYFIEVEENKIILKENVFKRENTGVVSLDSEEKVYEAFDGVNYDSQKKDNCGPIDLSKKDYQGDKYCTGINYWDYNQHHYSTTKVTLHSPEADIKCGEIEFTDSEIKKEYIDENLTSCKQGEKSKYTLTINDEENCTKESENKYKCYASNKLDCKIFVEKLCPKEYKETFPITINGNYAYVKLKNGSIITQSIGEKECEIIIDNPTPSSSSGGSSSGGSSSSSSGGGSFSGGISIGFTADPDSILGTDVDPKCIGGYCFHSQPSGSSWDTNTGIKYANLEDYFEYELDLTDKFDIAIPKGAQPIVVKQFCDDKNFKCNQDLDKTGKKIIIEEVNFSGFKIKSAHPGKFTNRFLVEFYKWKPNGETKKPEKVQIVVQGSTTNEFKAPISIKEIKVSDDGKKFTSTIDVAKEAQTFKVILEGVGELIKKSQGSLKIKNISDRNIEGNVSIIGSVSESDERFKIFTSTFPTFKADLEYKDSKDVLGTKFALKDIPISYKLKYNNKFYDVNYTISGEGIECKEKTKGVIIKGNLQATGIVNSTEGKVNYTDVSKATMRDTIRKNAYKLVLNREDTKGKIVNGIYYNEGNTIYSSIKGLQKGDTIIIKNGNLTIDKNIENAIGIIILADNYNVEDNNEQGNIYISPSVETIKAAIYADGGLLGKDSSNTPLVLNGALFTRNTIGGSIDISDTQYILPGGIKTTDKDLAEKYDLHYLREMEKSCSEEVEAAFTINYSGEIQINPPKGFAK